MADAGVFAGDEVAATEQDGELTIKLRANGSLGVQGNCAVVSADGAVSRTDNTALCRCGGSANKPFCDATHKRIGFAAQLKRELMAWAEGRSRKHESDIHQMLVFDALQEASSTLDIVYIDRQAQRLGEEVLRLWRTILEAARGAKPGSKR